MASDFLSKVRKINWILQEAPKGEFSVDDLCAIMGEMTAANTYIADIDGNLLGVYYQKKEDSDIVVDEETGNERFPHKHNDRFLTVRGTEANLQNEEALELFPDTDDTRQKYHTIIPIIGGGKRWGTMIMARDEPEFSKEDIALAEIEATVVGLTIQRLEGIRQAEEDRKEEVVRMAINTLSYSENEAVQRIFEELGSDEGILVASKIADKSRITRSVIVNALRKLESAGIIESKSLGMKGTHIKILNDKFFAELNKMKKA